MLHTVDCEAWSKRRTFPGLAHVYPLSVECADHDVVTV
jgi:hypothetical protein